MEQSAETQQNTEIAEDYPGAAEVVRTELYLPQLWSDSLTTSVAAALMAYRSDGGDSVRGEDLVNEIALEFRRILIMDAPKMPDTAAGVYIAVVRAIWQVTRRARLNRDAPHSVAHFLIALRAVRRFQAGILTAEICAALHDFCWNSATLKLQMPNRYRLEEALAVTLAALPPNELGPYWQNLQSENPQIRQSMRMGLKFFRSTHSVPHLLSTLENVPDHDIRAEIVDILEQIGEPSALPVLMRLKKQMALTDWTLSRHIGRAIKVIELHNRGHHFTNLLRSSDAPPVNDKELLRPAGEAQFNAERDRAELLRTENRTDEDTNTAANDKTPEETA